jgi:hypothetical protein
MTDRRPFDPRGVPCVVRIPGRVEPTVFGPFPDPATARTFLDDNPFPMFTIDVLFPPEDVSGFRYHW